MANKLQYITHSILQSKYKMLINLTVYLVISFLISNAQIAICMIEGNDLPEIAETKDNSNYIVHDLIHEIKDFAGSRIELLEQIEHYKEELAKSKSEIDQLTKELEETIKYSQGLTADNKALEYKTQYQESQLESYKKQVANYRLFDIIDKRYCTNISDFSDNSDTEDT